MRRMYSKNQINTQIEGVIKSGSIDNAKPIYFHPIYFVYDDESASIWLSWFILDNDPTAYTFATLKAKFRELVSVGARFITTGGIKVKGTSAWLQAIITEDQGDNKTQVFCANGTTADVITLENLNPENITAFQDGVNKIN